MGLRNACCPFFLACLSPPSPPILPVPHLKPMTQQILSNMQNDCVLWTDRSWREKKIPRVSAVLRNKSTAQSTASQLVKTGLQIRARCICNNTTWCQQIAQHLQHHLAARCSRSRQRKSILNKVPATQYACSPRLIKTASKTHNVTKHLLSSFIWQSSF